MTATPVAEVDMQRFIQAKRRLEEEHTIEPFISFTLDGRRAAAKFVHIATRFDAQIRVTRDGRVMDGKSIMGLLLLAAAQGCLITISASGVDEEQALAALCALVARGFDEVTPCA